MNMLRFFLLDEMFPNVCDKLCKLFSKQKTFNFTQHIPPWKGKNKQRYGIRSMDMSPAAAAASALAAGRAQAAQ